VHVLGGDVELLGRVLGLSEQALVVREPLVEQLLDFLLGP